MSARLERKSDSQANAEALARRGMPYAEDHERTAARALARREPRTLRDLVRELRRAHEMEAPARIHSRDTADDGAPQWHPEFTHAVAGSPRSLDEDGFYDRPFNAALSRTSGTTLDIVVRVVVAGDGPAEAAVAAGVPGDIAKRTAANELRWFWSVMTSAPLPTRTSAS